MRGQPDYGMYAPKEATASISDMGEVAARLGSIVTYDKRGDVVEFDNFEDPVLKWLSEVDHVDSYARLASDNAKSGSQAVRLHTRDAADGFAYIYKSITTLLVKRMGIEISFSKLSIDCDLLIWIYYYDYTTKHHAWLRVDPEAGKLYVMYPRNVDVEIADIVAVESEEFIFYTTKLVLDFENDLYRRVLFGTHEFDVSSIAMPTEEVPTHPLILIELGLYNRADIGGDVWIDDFVFTQAEP